MNILVEKPKHITSLATSSMLVQVRVKLWSATKTDREISDELTVAKRAKEKTAKVVKDLFNGDRDYRAMALYRQTISNWNKRMTWDWAGDFRCLPMFRLNQWLSEYEQHEKVYSDLVENFCNTYEDKINNQAFAQGDMFKRSDYPSLSEVRGKCGISNMVIEVPTSDFRSAVSEDLAMDLNKHYQRETEKIVANVMNESWSRLHTFVKRLSHACSDTTTGKNGKEQKPRVYQTTIDQVKELADLLDTFNITNDSDLSDATNSIRRTLAGIDAESIRESEATRAAVKSEIDQMMNKFTAARGVFDTEDDE